MKALSVRQPWASLIASGAKTIETRTWSTDYRGDLLICASKSPCPEQPDLPTGVALCIATLIEVRPMTSADAKAACCDPYPRAMSWLLTNIRPVEPFPVSGRLHLFEVDLPRLIQSARTPPPLLFEPGR